MIRLGHSLARALLPALLLACGASCGGDDPGGPGGQSARGRGPDASPADLSAWDWPALASRRMGDTWLACIAWEQGADALEMRPVRTSLPAGSPRAAPQRVYRSPTRMLGTALGSDASDSLHLVWSEQVEQGWELREIVFAATTETGQLGEAGEPVVLQSQPGRHLLQPALAADAEGRLLLTWIALDAEGQRLMGAVHDGARGWSAPAPLSGGSLSNWTHEATATGPGRFAVVWDAALEGDYDVHIAFLELDAQGAPVVTAHKRVTDTPRFEAHPSITVDGERLYVAYDVGPERWGREGSTNRLEVSLHAERRIELVAIEKGQVAPLAVSPLLGMNDALADNCELPRVRCESTGNVMLFFRGLPLPGEFDDPENAMFQVLSAQKPGGSGFRTSIWYTYMTRFDGEAWMIGDKHHIGLPGSEGRADAPCALTNLPGGGTAYAVVGDGRAAPTQAGGQPVSPLQAADPSTWWAPVTRQATQVTAALVKKESRSGLVLLDTASARPLAEPPPAARGPAAPPTRSTATGEELRLALGDLHRHTDLSRCSANWDGPIGDALRYASDVAPLQFLAITDHFEHMTAYDWWRTVSTMDAWNAPGRLVTLRGYERSDSMTGHRNVISGDGGPPLVGYPKGYEPGRDALRATTIEELWAALAGQRTLTIPHTPAGMFPANPSVFDWSSFDPEYDRLLEVFQSYRGSSEAVDAPRAIPDLKPSRYVRPNLDLGLHFGLIASSDHQSSDGAFAGAWVGALTREGVYDALHARRTFASTVPASLWLEWNGVPMGASVQQPAGATGSLLVEVDGFGRPLAKLEVFSNGGLLQERPLTGTVARESLAFDAPASGSRYAYARITFADGELMWSSPVRLAAGDWDGADGPSGRQVLQRQGDVWQVRPAER